jgi:hypothetical protein
MPADDGPISPNGLPMAAADAKILKTGVPPLVSDIDVSTGSASEAYVVLVLTFMLNMFCR